MYKDHRYINAGENEFYRWGREAVSRVAASLIPENGYYSIIANGGKYWTFGTSKGRYGEFAKIGETCFSVNRGGFLYAKADTEKGDKFVEGIKNFIQAMEDHHRECSGADDDEEE